MADASYNWKDKIFLIVEDNAGNYELLATYLKKTGAKLIWVTDGGEAIKVCKLREDINIVLMDIQLIAVNGYDATREIKQIRPNLPIIAQTAYALAGDREKSLEAGCDDYIAKPILKSVFFKTVARYIDQNHHNPGIS